MTTVKISILGFEFDRSPRRLLAGSLENVVLEECMPSAIEFASSVVACSQTFYFSLNLSRSKSKY